jgi:hypothetical protein
MKRLSTLLVFTLLATTASLKAGGGFDISKPEPDKIAAKKAKFKRRASEKPGTVESREDEQKLKILHALHPAPVQVPYKEDESFLTLLFKIGLNVGSAYLSNVSSDQQRELQDSYRQLQAKRAWRKNEESSYLPPVEVARVPVQSPVTVEPESPKLARTSAGSPSPEIEQTVDQPAHIPAAEPKSSAVQPMTSVRKATGAKRVLPVEQKAKPPIGRPLPAGPKTDLTPPPPPPADDPDFVVKSDYPDTPPPLPPRDDESTENVVSEVSQPSGLLAEIGKVKLRKAKSVAKIIDTPKVEEEVSEQFAKMKKERERQEQEEEEDLSVSMDDDVDIKPATVAEFDDSFDGRLKANRRDLDEAEDKLKETLKQANKVAKVGDKEAEAKIRRAEDALPMLKERVNTLRQQRLPILLAAIEDCDIRLAKSKEEMNDRPNTWAKRVEPRILFQKQDYQERYDLEIARLADAARSYAELAKEAEASEAAKDAMIAKVRAKTSESEEDSAFSDKDWE